MPSPYSYVGIPPLRFTVITYDLTERLIEVVQTGSQRRAYALAAEVFEDLNVERCAIVDGEKPVFEARRLPPRQEHG